MIEMVVDSIRASTQNYQRVMILKEKKAERCLPIWIGPTEADAIAIKIQGVTIQRPLTHDLMYSIISALMAQIDFVLLNDIRGDTFYAKIMFNINGKTIEIDSRPSDAIALAVRAGVKIFTEESVLDTRGMIMDKDTGKIVIPDNEGEEAGGKKIGEEELKKLSAFRDFIDGTDLDNLGKSRP